MDSRPEYSTVKVGDSPVLGRSAEQLSASSDVRSFSPATNDFAQPNFEDEAKQSLLSSSARLPSNRRDSLAVSVSSPAVQLLIKLTLALTALGLSLSVLVRLAVIPSPSKHISASLGPFVPASVLALVGPGADGQASPHPILPHIVKARDDWSKLVGSQSTTFTQASRSYRNRYKREPPSGFDKWFAFATQGKNHSLVDEYDGLMRDLEPFRALSPAEIKRRTNELAQVPGISIVSIRGGAAQVHAKSGKWAPALAFQEMLADFIKDLPDMDIAINEKPEGRVLPRTQRKISSADYGLEGELPVDVTDPVNNPSLSGFTAEWKESGTTWQAYRRSCPTDSSARRLIESVRSVEVNGAHAGLLQQSSAEGRTSLLSRRRVREEAYPPTREMTFNSKPDSSVNMCDDPSLHTIHSAFFTDQRSIEYLYPVFSPSKPDGYADILIPSHHYWTPSSELTYEWELKRGRTQEHTDLAWADKKSTIYYRGKATKGADSPPGHSSSFQKQRLVQMANTVPVGLPDRILVAFDDKTAALTSTKASAEKINSEVVDIALACDPSLGECSYLRSQGYRVEPPMPLGEAWKHKFVLDVDEVGFSPKFLALMESQSAVIKSSIQTEFWQSWIQPWKHYIPLSSSFSELYNIGTFFTGFPAGLGNETHPVKVTTLSSPSPVPALPTTADGSAFATDKLAQDIANAGSEWRTQYLRKEDMECYVYRLMIEWAAMITPPASANTPQAASVEDTVVDEDLA